MKNRYHGKFIMTLKYANQTSHAIYFSRIFFQTKLNTFRNTMSVKSIFYKNDIRKSKVSKIPLFLPRYFVNKGKGTNTFKATSDSIYQQLSLHESRHALYRKVNQTGCDTSNVIEIEKFLMCHVFKKPGQK